MQADVVDHRQRSLGSLCRTDAELRRGLGARVRAGARARRHDQLRRGHVRGRQPVTRRSKRSASPWRRPSTSTWKRRTGWRTRGWCGPSWRRRPTRSTGSKRRGPSSAVCSTYLPSRPGVAPDGRLRQGRADRAALQEGEEAGQRRDPLRDRGQEPADGRRPGGGVVAEDKKGDTDPGDGQGGDHRPRRLPGQPGVGGQVLQVRVHPAGRAGPPGGIRHPDGLGRRRRALRHGRHADHRARARGGPAVPAAHGRLPAPAVGQHAGRAVRQRVHLLEVPHGGQRSRPAAGRGGLVHLRRRHPGAS